MEFNSQLSTLFGVRTLLCLIPNVGKALIPIADFAFKSIGVTPHATSGIWSKHQPVFVSIVGLGSEILVPLSVIASSAPEVVTFNEHVGDRDFVSRFKVARITTLSISLEPGSEMQNRQGEWALCFTPFFSKDDEEAYRQPKAIPTFNNVASRPGARFGPASKPLTFTFWNENNSYLDMYHNWDTSIGVLTIAYQDTIRDTFAEFKSTETSPIISIRGQATMRSPVINGYQKFSSNITDVLGNIGMTVLDTSTNKVYLVKNDGKFRCRKDRTSKSCVVYGNVEEVTNGVQCGEKE